MPRLWATLPILETSFMNRPFIRAQLISPPAAALLLGEAVPLLIRRGQFANRTSRSTARTVRRGAEGYEFSGLIRVPDSPLAGSAERRARACARRATDRCATRGSCSPVVPTNNRPFLPFGSP